MNYYSQTYTNRFSWTNKTVLIIIPQPLTYVKLCFVIKIAAECYKQQRQFRKQCSHRSPRTIHCSGGKRSRVTARWQGCVKRHIHTSPTRRPAASTCQEQTDYDCTSTLYKAVLDIVFLNWYNWMFPVTFTEEANYLRSSRAYSRRA